MPRAQLLFGVCQAWSRASYLINPFPGQTFNRMMNRAVIWCSLCFINPCDFGWSLIKRSLKKTKAAKSFTYVSLSVYFTKDHIHIRTSLQYNTDFSSAQPYIDRYVETSHSATDNCEFIKALNMLILLTGTGKRRAVYNPFSWWCCKTKQLQIKMQ